MDGRGAKTSGFPGRPAGRQRRAAIENGRRSIWGGGNGSGRASERTRGDHRLRRSRGVAWWMRVPFRGAVCFTAPARVPASQRTPRAYPLSFGSAPANIVCECDDDCAENYIESVKVVEQDIFSSRPRPRHISVNPGTVLHRPVTRLLCSAWSRAVSTVLTRIRDSEWQSSWLAGTQIWDRGEYGRSEEQRKRPR
jgi:hypothetical protein